MDPSPCPGVDSAGAVRRGARPSPRHRHPFAALLTVALLVPLGSGCRKQAVAPAPEAAAAELRQGQVQGHAATVRCLRGERALTDGDELRCEDWVYVLSNYSSGASKTH